jgi:hypothetical protein
MTTFGRIQIADVSVVQQAAALSEAGDRGDGLLHWRMST